MTTPPSTPSRSLNWRSLSLRTKLVIAFLAVTVIPLVIVSFITYNSTRTALTNDANQKLAAAAQQTAASVDSFINYNLESVRAAGQFPAVVDYVNLPASQRAGSPEELRIQKFIAAMARQDPIYISSVAVYDAKGITLADSYVADIGSDKSSRRYFQDTLKTELPYASDVEYSSTTGVASLYFAAPVRDTAGHVLGIIRVRYFASILQTLITENTGLAGESSYAVLLDKYHVRLAHGTDRNRVFRSIVPLDAATLTDLQAQGLMPAGTAQELSTNLTDFEAGLNNLANAPYFAADTNGDGGLEQTAVATLTSRPDWQVAFIQSQVVFLQPITTQTTNTLLVAVVIALVTGVVGFGFSQTLAGPIVRLTQIAQAVSAGNIDARAKVETGDEIGTLAGAFNTMTAQLRDFIGTLEQRVADRTRALATSTEVSRRLSTILEQKVLVTEVVNQVKGAFNYYHAQIYFFDEDKEQLVMAGGSGEAGSKMLEQGHKIPKGRGLVGRAAANNEPILVSNTSLDSNWLPNPLLPETKSETAIPIAIGDEVLGVLDVQHNVPDGLKREDVELLQSIANQVAVAMQNIRSTEAVAKRATELQNVATISTITSTIQNEEEMLTNVVHLVQRRFGLYHAHVFTYRESTDDLQIVACGYKEGDEHEGTHGATIIPLEREQSLVARAGRTRQAVIVNDVRSDPGWLPNPLLPDTAAELAVPLLVGDKLIGVLDVQADYVNAFTDEDAAIQTTLASQIAIAVQNSRSFAQAQKQANRETTLNLISQRIQNATTIESAMQIAARELGHALGMKPTLVSLDPSALTGEKNN